MAGYPPPASSRFLPVSGLPYSHRSGPFPMSFMPLITTSDPYPVSRDPDMLAGRGWRSFIDNFSGPFMNYSPHRAGRQRSDADNQSQVDKNSLHKRGF